MLLGNLRMLVSGIGRKSNVTNPVDAIETDMRDAWNAVMPNPLPVRLTGAELAALDLEYPHSELERKLRGVGIVTSGSEAHNHG